MIVCICNNISSKVLVDYRSRGLNLEDLRQDYGLASSCGQCLATAEHMMTQPKTFSSNKLIPATELVAAAG
jgi:bacterioferritin-associated ferredoxin